MRCGSEPPCGRRRGRRGAPPPGTAGQARWQAPRWPAPPRAPRRSRAGAARSARRTRGPPAPIIEAMMTMLSDSMMTWLTPTISGSRAEGISTRHICCRGVQPTMRPRSWISGGNARERQRGDARHRRHGIDQRGHHRRGRPEAEQDQDRHQIGKDRHRLHQVEQPASARARTRHAPGERCPGAARPATPSGTATRIEASVTIALCHWPKTATNRKHPAMQQRQAARRRPRGPAAQRSR